MSQAQDLPPGPDLTAGVPIADIPGSGMLAGHVAGSAVLLSRDGDELHAVGGMCTHYGAPLAQGLADGGVVRCPWHHACFSLRTGAALSAPAFAPLARYRVERRGDLAVVGAEPAPPAVAPTRRPRHEVRRIVIVGGGAAGFAAADRLRGLGYGGALTLLSADGSAPYDRPNLSKDYLAGTAPEDWIPLKPVDYYRDSAIDLRLETALARIDPHARAVHTRSGERIDYDRLLLATGAEPVAPDVSGAGTTPVYTLRSLADARALIAGAMAARTAVVVGMGFIGLETAGALRARGLEVHVIGRGSVPLADRFGIEIGRFLMQVHREHGIVFHPERRVAGLDRDAVVLDDGRRIPAGVVVAGLGVKPRTAVAAAAGIAVDDGILVNPRLMTSAPDIYAAGDVARIRRGDESARIEHWVWAQRQGQAAAANLLGADADFDDVPFFWSNHHDVALRHVGYAPRWDALQIDGSLADRDFIARYFRDGRLLAAVSVGRDRENLALEAELRHHACGPEGKASRAR
jgi:NADPH-dependent 2,4-dienoyl-CoA reductase/sulfur reductase-like enzyme/nitrite reductase/ring-hydroxylating ferredoxin subunit